MPCGFCKDEPVGNARRWTDPDAPPYAPCPRCGVLREPSLTDVMRDRRPPSMPDDPALWRPGGLVTTDDCDDA